MNELLFFLGMCSCWCDNHSKTPDRLLGGVSFLWISNSDMIKPAFRVAPQSRQWRRHDEMHSELSDEHEHVNADGKQHGNTRKLLPLLP